MVVPGEQRSGFQVDSSRLIPKILPEEFREYRGIGYSDTAVLKFGVLKNALFRRGMRKSLSLRLL